MMISCNVQCTSRNGLGSPCLRPCYAGRAGRDNLQQHELPRTHRAGEKEPSTSTATHGKQHLAGPLDLPDHASKRPHIANIVVGHTLHLPGGLEDFARRMNSGPSVYPAAKSFNAFSL